MKPRIAAVLAVLLVAAFALAGCSTQARAERKGKEAADQICKAKNANNANDAQRHIRKANDKIDDLARFTGRDVNDEVRDLQRNLNQLSRGNGTSQDINAIQQSIESARSSAHGNAVAAYDGMLEGLANCE